jgi:phosphoglycerate dehydrogenase-like enzyme
LLEKYANVRFNDEGIALGGAELIAFARGREKMIIGLERIDEAFLAAVPELNIIGKYGVGTDRLDSEAMVRHGVRLGWTGGVNRRSVAELAIAMMLSLLRQIPQSNADIRAGVWKNRKGKELSSCSVGIVGCGHVGKELSVLLRAFGCQVFAHDILHFPDFYVAHQIEPMALEPLLRRSEIVSLHIPFDASTRNILSAERLALLPPETLLINTARGGLVDEVALKQMLIEGQLAGAGFDAFAEEPPQDEELLQHPNFLSTPHIGGSSQEAILSMGRAAIKGLDENTLPLVE